MNETPDVDAIQRNLKAVRDGAMWADEPSGRFLLAKRYIRLNRRGWYDLTPAGRRYLASLADVAQARRIDQAQGRIPEWPGNVQ